MTITDLANSALAQIGQTAITTIDDENVKAAVVCKQFWRLAADEVLRQHRWNSASKRATLAAVVAPAEWGYKFAYQLPADFIRMMELNGEQVDASEEFFEIEGSVIKTDASKADIRYIRQLPVSSMDASLFEVVACKLASKIAIPLAANPSLQIQALNLMERALGAARKVDAIETGSRENRPLLRALGNSPLLQARGMNFLPRPRR